MHSNQQLDKFVNYFCNNFKRVTKKSSKKNRSRWIRRKAKEALRKNEDMPIQNRYHGWVS